jgi:hypothetical protein
MKLSAVAGENITEVLRAVQQVVAARRQKEIESVPQPEWRP